jgi:hypothetical protein
MTPFRTRAFLGTSAQYPDTTPDKPPASRISMVFVADVIPDELMRITEFLNGQVNTSEVVAVEVKLMYDRFGREGVVPRSGREWRVAPCHTRGEETHPRVGLGSR